MDIEAWKDDACMNCKERDDWIDKRSKIQQNMKDYLSKFFSWDEIDFDYDLNRVTLKYEYNHDSVIRMDNIKDFDIDFIITTGSSDNLGMGVWIEIYPFGLPSDIMK